MRPHHAGAEQLAGEDGRRVDRLREEEDPGKLNYGSSGNGTIVQLTAELFISQAGISVAHIPYKGTALAVPDLISGKIDVLFDALPTGMPHVRAGRLRALGVTSLGRSPLMPLPPIADTLPGFESNTWFGLYGPKGLPPNSWAASMPRLTGRSAMRRCASNWPGSASRRRTPGRRPTWRPWWRRTAPNGRRSSSNARSRVNEHEFRLREPLHLDPHSGLHARNVVSTLRTHWPRRPACASCSRAATRSTRRSRPPRS